jgi:uncharacterized membrane protein
MRYITNPVAIGVVIGASVRFAMAHGDWTLFFNPWFPMLVHYQPWV